LASCPLCLYRDIWVWRWTGLGYSYKLQLGRTPVAFGQSSSTSGLILDSSLMLVVPLQRQRSNIPITSLKLTSKFSSISLSHPKHSSSRTDCWTPLTRPCLDSRRPVRSISLLRASRVSASHDTTKRRNSSGGASQCQQKARFVPSSLAGSQMSDDDVSGLVVSRRS
jgi:hypothetical protein